MVDAADSKSAAFTGVRVRVSPRAPSFGFNIPPYNVIYYASPNLSPI